MPTVATLFAGCGGKTWGAMRLGFTPIWAIELDSAIAQIYSQNIDGDVLVKDILEVDPKTLEPPDLLLISPPCPNFSSAKLGRQEQDSDRALAFKIVEFIQVLNPKAIMIENVRGYQNSQSYQIITSALLYRRSTATSLSSPSSLIPHPYYWDAQVLNAADFGVPQNRHRLIIRVSDRPLPPIIPTHSKKPTNAIFGNLLPQRGWYEAIGEKTISSLPRMSLTPSQFKRIGDRALPEIALIELGGHSCREIQIVQRDRPSFTILARSGKVSHGITQANIKVGDRVYRATSKALARIQSFPKSWEWSDSEKTNIKAIGNAVPPLLAEAVIKSFGFEIALPSTSLGNQSRGREFAACGQIPERPCCCNLYGQYTPFACHVEQAIEMELALAQFKQLNLSQPAIYGLFSR